LGHSTIAFSHGYGQHADALMISPLVAFKSKQIVVKLPDILSKLAHAAAARALRDSAPARQARVPRTASPERTIVM
jgi:hypothetical protein